MQKFNQSLRIRNLNAIIILGLIFVISLFVQSYKLSEVPNGVYMDEATTGVNANSILKTGKDEYGKSFPQALRFFGSYSPPFYTYLTIIPVAFFSLNEFSVRIISVISAALMIFIVYGFLMESNLVNRKIIYLLLLLFIITPWNFFYARTGYESYLSFFLFYIGAFLCWIGLEKRKYLIGGFLILSLSTYASHSEIYSVPIFVLGFLGLFYKKLDRKYLWLGIILALVIQIPRMMIIDTEAFFIKGSLFYYDEIILNAGKIVFLPKIISIPLSFTFSFFARVITYFSPYSLFFLPDPDPQRSIPELSVFYNWMAIPFLIGVYIFAVNIRKNYIKYLILLMAASVIPAALTGDPFSTQRGLNLLLPLFLIISFGLSFIYEKVKLAKFLAGFALVIFISLVFLWRSYFVLMPGERAIAWNYGYKEIAEFIKKNPDQHFVVEQFHGKPSYIELYFFLETDPQILQDSVDPEIRKNYYNLTAFNPDYKFGNIETRAIIWDEDIYKPQILIGDELSVSEKQAGEHFLKEVLEIKEPRGYPIIRGFLTDPEKKCTQTNFESVFCKKYNE